MDERVKEAARSTIDEDLSHNRNLRDEMDGTAIKSPRKSPRLMTQGSIQMKCMFMVGAFCAVCCKIV